MSRILDMLVRETGLRERDIMSIAANAPRRYKTYFIEKKSGGKREISQPSVEVKFLQRALLQSFLYKLSVHPSAMAYRSGMSIADNASAHTGAGAIVKMDFKNFFPSIRAQDWRSYCEERNLLADDEIDLTSQIFFRQTMNSSILRLAIGAPSSPTLSNIIMEGFDRKIAEIVARDKIVYTRYADDLTFSAPRAWNLKTVVKSVKNTIFLMKSPRLRVNDEKTLFVTKKYSMMVTGMVLAQNGVASLGRDRKRRISAAVDHYRNGKLKEASHSHLRGMLAFANSVEPEFIERLSEKYGADIIERIKKI